MSEFADSELSATQTEGYKVGEKKTAEELANLDNEDEALNKWKASLGVTASSGSGVTRVEIISLKLNSDRPAGPIVLDLLSSGALKKDPIIIKEGCDYSVEIEFKVHNGIVSGLKYIQVVKRAGITFDKLESMIGSFGPSDSINTKKVTEAEAPDGMLARSGTYNVRSRVVDDDNQVHIDFSWSFKLGKTWDS